MFREIQEYVARIENPCGEERDFIVIFRQEMISKVNKKIIRKAKLKKEISPLIFELNFRNTSFRLYSNGKAIFRGMKNKEELQDTLTDLLLSNGDRHKETT